MCEVSQYSQRELLRMALLHEVKALRQHLLAQHSLAGDGFELAAGALQSRIESQGEPIRQPAQDTQRQASRAQQHEKLQPKQEGPQPKPSTTRRPPQDPERRGRPGPLAGFREFARVARGPIPLHELPESERPASLEVVRQALGDCTRCPLHKGRTKLVFGEGNPNARLLFIGEGPGYHEDQQGRPFVGASGELLTKIIAAMSLSREEVYIANIVKCRPPNNRDPLPNEVMACEPFLQQQILVIKPEVIVTIGRVPTHALLRTKGSITRMRGQWQDYRGVPVMPTLHPAYLLRQPQAKRHVWADMKAVMQRLGIEPKT